MGRAGAEAMAELDISLETAIAWHLGHNHYPPVPEVMVPVCIEAIGVANQDGPWDAELKLPDGIEYKNRTHVPVGEVISTFHLEPWIEEEL